MAVLKVEHLQPYFQYALSGPVQRTRYTYVLTILTIFATLLQYHMVSCPSEIANDRSAELDCLNQDTRAAEKCVLKLKI